MTIPSNNKYKRGKGASILKDVAVSAKVKARMREMERMQIQQDKLTSALVNKEGQANLQGILEFRKFYMKEMIGNQSLETLRKQLQERVNFARENNLFESEKVAESEYYVNIKENRINELSTSNSTLMEQYVARASAMEEEISKLKNSSSETDTLVDNIKNEQAAELEIHGMLKSQLQDMDDMLSKLKLERSSEIQEMKIAPVHSMSTSPRIKRLASLKAKRSIGKGRSSILNKSINSSNNASFLSIPSRKISLNKSGNTSTCFSDISYSMDVTIEELTDTSMDMSRINKELESIQRIEKVNQQIEELKAGIVKETAPINKLALSLDHVMSNVDRKVNKKQELERGICRLKDECKELDIKYRTLNDDIYILKADNERKQRKLDRLMRRNVTR